MSEFVTKHKTFIMAVGLVGLAVHLFSVGKYEEALGAAMSAVGLIFEGVRPD